MKAQGQVEHAVTDKGLQRDLDLCLTSLLPLEAPSVNTPSLTFKVPLH